VKFQFPGLQTGCDCSADRNIYVNLKSCPANSKTICKQLSTPISPSVFSHWVADTATNQSTHYCLQRLQGYNFLSNYMTVAN